MSEIKAFFHMGGYAPYVWASYGLTAAVLLGQLLRVKRSFKQQWLRLVKMLIEESH